MTFQKAPTATGAAILTFAATSTANYTVQLTAASNLTFKDLTLANTAVSGQTVGGIVEYGGNTCIESKNDMPDMFENYMDYSTEACQNIFTKQQVSMMRKSITEYRVDLPIKMDIITKLRIYDTVVYNDILIYPKSNINKVMVEVKNEDVLDQLEVQFFTMLGQAITEPIAIKKNETLVDTESWSTGAYVARLVRSSDGKVIRKQKLFVE